MHSPHRHSPLTPTSTPPSAPADVARVRSASPPIAGLLLRESALLKELERSYEGEASGSGADWKRLSSLLMQLRKCCNHPFLFPGAEPASDEAYAEQLISGSGKFALLDRLLAKLFAGGHRVVLFSQFTSTLDLLEELLAYREYKYCRLDGSTNRVQRTVDINAFNMTGSSRFVFLMSTRAGGLGINCQTADTCILFDSDWNPQVDMQAMARVHRIGQKKVVHLYRLVSSGTVEERIVQVRPLLTSPHRSPLPRPSLTSADPLPRPSLTSADLRLVVLQRAEKKLYLDRMVNRDSSDPSQASPRRT